MVLSVLSLHRLALIQRLFWLAVLCSLVSLLPSVYAQRTNPNTYYQQCLKFEAGNDLTTAAQNCRNALELDPNYKDATIALARILLAQGNPAEAQSLLSDVRGSNNPEVNLLLADIAIQSDQLDEAAGHIRAAQGILAESPNGPLEARAYFLQGKLAEERSDFEAALQHYRDAATLDALRLDYRLALSKLLFNLGDLDTARSELELYQTLVKDQDSGLARNPKLLSELGRIKWAQGDLVAAATDIETAVVQRGSRDATNQAQDLRTLALIYYGLGDTRKANLALQDALGRGTSWLSFLGLSVPWLLVLVIVLALHLWGESRISSKTSMEVIETPQLWSVGHIYTSLLMSLAVAVVAAFAFSVLRYNNFLALATPWQANEVRAVFVLALTLMLAFTAVWRATRNGWDPVERLIGSIDQSPLGVLSGVILLAAALGYMAIAPRFGLESGYYLNLAKLTPLIIAAAILLPLSELYFRAFVMPPLIKRYDRSLAFFIAAALSALAFASPLFLLIAVGLLLSEVFRRTNSGVNPLIAQLVLNFGLIMAVQFVPWVHGLFL
jgi:tetratricopeptide (TPR) repeat protein/membrane protease YdiL (CAAX protease family)